MFSTKANLLKNTNLVSDNNETQNKIIKIFINGDQYFRGVNFEYDPQEIVRIEDLFEAVTKSLPNIPRFQYGVRQIFTPRGFHRIRRLKDLRHGNNYVCAGRETFKPVKYDFLVEKNHAIEDRVSMANKKKVSISLPRVQNIAESDCNSNATNKTHQKNHLITETKLQDHFDHGECVIVIVRNSQSSLTKFTSLKIAIRRSEMQTLGKVLSDISEAFGPQWRHNRLRSLYHLNGREVRSLAELMRNPFCVLIGLDQGISNFSKNSDVNDKFHISGDDIKDIVKEHWSAMREEAANLAKQWEKRRIPFSVEIQEENSSSKSFQQIRPPKVSAFSPDIRMHDFRQKRSTETHSTNFEEHAPCGQSHLSVLALKGALEENQHDSGFDESTSIITSRDSEEALHQQELRRVGVGGSIRLLSPMSQRSSRRIYNNRKRQMSTSETSEQNVTRKSVKNEKIIKSSRLYKKRISFNNESQIVSSSSEDPFPSIISEISSQNSGRNVSEPPPLQRKHQGDTLPHMISLAKSRNPGEQVLQRTKQSAELQRIVEQKSERRFVLQQQSDISPQYKLRATDYRAKAKNVLEPIFYPSKTSQTVYASLDTLNNDKQMSPSNSSEKSRLVEPSQNKRQLHKIIESSDIIPLNEVDELGYEEEEYPVVQTEELVQELQVAEVISGTVEVADKVIQLPIVLISKVQPNIIQDGILPTKSDPDENTPLESSPHKTYRAVSALIKKQDSSSILTPRTYRLGNLGKIVENTNEILEQYDIGKLLGDGNFAVVKSAKRRSDGHEFAIKIIEKAKLRGKLWMLENEIKIMRRCNHQNILRLRDEFETENEVWLVVDYIKGGDLFDAISKSVRFPEDVASKMVFDLASALYYLHARFIVHRDLKPENVLVLRHRDGRLTLKLADFGLAMEVKQPIQAVCGTPTYIAPEILMNIGYGLPVDVWALGVITYIILCGFPPFKGAKRSQTDLFRRIKEGTFEFTRPYWDRVSSSAMSLILRILVVDQDRRCKAVDVLCDPWVYANGKPPTSSDPEYGVFEASRQAYRDELESYASRNKPKN